MTTIRKLSEEEYLLLTSRPEITAIDSLDIGEAIEITNSRYKTHLAQVIQGYKKTLFKIKRFTTVRTGDRSYLVKRTK